MLSQISYVCASYLLNKNKITKLEIDLYQYGFEILITSLIPLFSIPIFALLFFHVRDGILFLLFFIPVRIFCGGYHASNYLKCYLCTMFVFIFTIGLTYLFPVTNLLLIVLLNLISGGYIFGNAPLIHPDNPLPKSKILINKNRARLIVMINGLSVCLLYFINSFGATLATYTITLVAIMMYIPKKGGNQYVG